MPDNSAFTGDAVTVLVQTVTKSIESTAGLTVKVDHLKESLDKYGDKIDGVMAGIAGLSTMTSTLNQEIKELGRDVLDHEARLRNLEPLKDRSAEHERELSSLSNGAKEQGKAIQEVKDTLIKYGAIAACIFFAFQLILSIFIVPWAQQVFLGQ